MRGDGGALDHYGPEALPGLRTVPCSGGCGNHVVTYEATGVCDKCRRPTTSPGGDSWYRQGGVEPVDFILSNNLPHWKGAAIAYVFRAGLKEKKTPKGPGYAEPPLRAGETEDIEKAIWWLNKRLEQIRGAD
jgi:hypothetical protein